MEPRRINTSRIPRREPVMTAKTFEPFKSFEGLNKQWLLLTEAIRRSLPNPRVREALQNLLSEPVSEELPQHCVERLQGIDPLVDGLIARYEKELHAYLQVQKVDENLVSPDVRSAAALEIPEDTVALLEKYYADDPDHQNTAIEEYIRLGRFTHGITAHEREMVTQRHRFGRDVKLLALAAELFDQPPLEPDEKGVATLPSGVRLLAYKDHISPEAFEELFRPASWVRRQQIKDRVYRAQVGERNYILKERKTRFHTDTQKMGHSDGRISMGEAFIAQQLQEKGRYQQGSIEVSWEKPIGAVDYPDGFQFALFVCEEKIDEGVAAIKEFEAALLADRESPELQEEFRQVREAAMRFKEDPRVRNLVKESGTGEFTQEDISFEEFASTKRSFVHMMSLVLMKRVRIALGLHNWDNDGYFYRAHIEKHPPTLEIIGMDFEYFGFLKPNAKFPELQSTVDDYFRMGFFDNFDPKLRAIALALQEVDAKRNQDILSPDFHVS